MNATERLVHFSAEVVTQVHDQHPKPGHLKPAGFWVSVEGNGDGWLDWCRAEQWALDALANAHEITLAPGSDILRIGTVAELDAFTEEYDLPHERPYLGRLGDRIDWERVARRYQGIIITPYLYARRLAGHAFWYYGWDCASGCIWDAEAIESVRLLPSPVLEASQP